MEIERSAASVEEAIEAALEELGVSEQEADVEIVQEPKGGFLGLKSQEAIVRVRARPTSRAEELTEDELGEQSEVAADFLDELFELMDLDAEVEPILVDGLMYIDVWGGEDDDEMALLIGRHGQTLDSLQEVVRAVVQRQTGNRCRVIVDVEDYRKRRRSQIVSRAQDIARRVKRTGKPEALEPMTPFERKIVHDAVAEVTGVDTESEGEEPNRSVVVRPRG